MNEAEQRRTRYARHLITYIDVLGFRKRVDASKNESALVPYIAELLNRTQGHLTVGGRIGRGKQGQPVPIFRTFNFSDLTVRCTRLLKRADVGDYLGWEVFYLSEVQMSLACEGVLLRGAICIGDLYARRKTLFGPGLVKAYDLENNYAIFPRLVVDRDLLQEAEKSPSVYRRDYITRGDDGVYSVDYLFGTVLRLHTDPTGQPGEPSPGDLVRRHRQAILEQLPFVMKDPRVRQKYLWLALYHNQTVKNLRDRFESAGKSSLFDNCSIDEAQLKFY